MMNGHRELDLGDELDDLDLRGCASAFEGVFLREGGVR